MAFNNLDKVSVIVISYNHQDYIDDCVNSILSQTYKNIELIIVDNFSRDSTREVLNKYVGLDGLRIIFLNKNTGMTGGMNEGMKYASGKYITFFASDDLMVSDRISRQVSFLSKHPDAAGCFGNMIRINNDGSINKKGLLPLVDERSWSMEDLLTKRICLYSPSQLYRMDIIKNSIVEFPENIKIEDIWLYYKLLDSGYKLYTLPHLFTLYRVHDSNTHTKYKMMMHEKIKILEEYKDRPFYKKALDFIYLEHFSNFCSTNKIEAIKLMPKVVTNIFSKYLYIGFIRLLFDWR
ncbi:glycosyltransferase family 2 protein [Hafnia alvei]|uniref:glycosyltransferase family 2 protein n=1 Tax=Hafnia alvei TaxID=569 RepID=UPI0024A926C8|nr:glycosyltransferase [Hafnia alvei]